MFGLGKSKSEFDSNNQNSAFPIQVKVDLIAFPDSGHHVKFIPLFANDEANAETIHERLSLVEQARTFTSEMQKHLIGLSNAAPANRKNIVKSPLPWIRAWIGSQNRLLPRRHEEEPDLNAKLVGIWIAVESNLGTRSRGYMTRISSPPVQTEVEAYNREREIETPYAYEKLADTLDKVESVLIHIDDMPYVGPLDLCSFQVRWIRPDGADPISVDLIVDFGNTRTAVLALEHIPGVPSLSTICKPIPFQSKEMEFEGFEGFQFDESSVLTDSWFLLKQPTFENPSNSNDEIPEWYFVNDIEIQGRFLRKEVAVRRLEKVTYRIPHMFVEMSPALIGPSARQELLNLNLEHGAKYFMSSPKRYVWDTDPAEGEGEQNWHMVLNDPTKLAGSISGLPNLECQMLRFLHANGSDWALNDPPTNKPQHQRPVRNPINPRYPRSDTLTWTALSVLENAYRTINTVAWRKGNRPFGARKLKRVIVTYPSGWTAAEIAAYRAKWQKAINIFMLTRIADPNPEEIQLVMTMDEAVASQLPIVISEIRRLGNNGRRWLNVIGVGKDAQARGRVMTVDIGGGTTDISVVEYQDALDGAGMDLIASVLFKDSNTIAGDQLRKMIIQKVLLPQVFGSKGNLDRAELENFLSGGQITMAAYAKWARYTRVLFLPIVNRWLADLVTGATESFTISDLFQSNEDGKILDDFNEESRNAVGIDLLDGMESLSIERYKTDVRKCIRECFIRPFRSLSKHVAAFACDLVIVTGKPSELPEIREMLEECLPITPNRLLFAKGFRAGSATWPLSKDGRVHDAKFVTVVGAALSQAIQSNLIRQQSNHPCSLKVVQDPRMLTQNWWGVPDGNKLDPVILEPSQSENTVTLKIGHAIGRKLLPGDSAPEPVYLLRWSDRLKKHSSPPSIQVTFRRVQSKPGEAEALEIVRAAGVLETIQPDGSIKKSNITKDHIELKLCTMQAGEQYWLDTGRFEIEWPEIF